MITGRHAFEGKSQLSVLAAILEKEPERISTLQPSSPPRLDETVRRCLAKNPDDRYGCMHDIRIQLADIAESVANGSTVQEPRKVVTWPAWLATGLTALITIGLAVAYFNRPSAPAPVVRSSLLPPPGTTFVLAEPDSAAPVLSPDGSKFAFVARDQKRKVMLYAQSLDSLQAQLLNGTDNAMYPFWSPDSRQIGFFTVDGKMKRVNASGGAPQVICDAETGRGGTWNRDGTIVFAPGTTDALLRVSADGGAPQPASKLDTAGENSHRWPYFLPDGSHFLFWARKSLVGQEGSLYIGELGSLNAKLLVGGGRPASYVPGYLLFVRDQVLMAQPFDTRKLALIGEPASIAEPVVVNETANRPIFSASENRNLIYRSGASASDFFRLTWIDREGKESDPHIQPGLYAYPDLSPDGTRLVTAMIKGAGQADIWVLDFVRGTRTRLTFGTGREDKPVWSPDGKKIYYDILEGGIHAKAADGSGEDETVLSSTPGQRDIPIGFSADRRHLLYLRRSVRKSPLDIWSLPLFGDRKPFPVLQSPFDKHEAETSPDGKWIAYHSDESGQSEVYIARSDGGRAKWEVSTQGGGHPKWRRDGKELFFLSSDNYMMAVDVSPSGDALRLGVPHALFHAEPIERLGPMYDVTADGKKFIITELDANEEGRPLTLVQNWTAEIKK